MFCPACLFYRQQVEAVSQVDGTAYCAAHGVEALNRVQTGANRRRAGGLTQPMPPVNALPDADGAASPGTTPASPTPPADSNTPAPS